MAQNQQLSVLGQVAPATTGTAGQVLVSAGNSASSYWASAIPVSAYSAQFNGSSNYFTIPNNSAFQFGTGAFTVETWVYITATPAYAVRIVGLGIGAYDASTMSAWAININSALTGLTFYRFDGTTETNLNQAYTFNLNTWYHIVAVRNASSTLSA